MLIGAAEISSSSSRRISSTIEYKTMLALRLKFKRATMDGRIVPCFVRKRHRLVRGDDMVRLFVFLALLCLAALGLTWPADHPGQVGLTWQGYRIETSLVMVVAVAMIVLAVLVALLWGIVRWLTRVSKTR
jgi:fatty acid desaturase